MNDKDCLLNRLEKLKELCEIPKLYLDNYFLDLRKDVDLEIASKNQSNNQDSISLWFQMIERINNFEKECLNIDFSPQETIQSLISIQLLMENSNSNHEEIHKLILNEENNILKKLFRNKTIVFIKISKRQSKIQKLIDGKLIVINDEFISLKEIKEK